jgi:hypothetical protein
LGLLLDSVERGGYGAAKVKAIFGGTLARPILCVACGDVTSPAPEEFTSLPLALARPGGRQDDLTVTRLLAEHLAEESLVDPSTGLPTRECDKCGSKQHALKSTVLTGRMPRHLLVSLKRFDHTGAKDTSPVALDPTLVLHPNGSLARAAKPFNPNLSPLPPIRGARTAAARAGRAATAAATAAAAKAAAAAAAASAAEEVKGGESDEETAGSSSRFEDRGDGFGSENENENEAAAFYDLYAVVVHQGDSLNNGHYFAFARSSSDVSAAAAAAMADAASSCNSSSSSAAEADGIDRRRQIFVDPPETNGDSSMIDREEGPWVGWYRYDDESVSPVTAEEWHSLMEGTLTWRKGKSTRSMPATPYILCYRHREDGEPPAQGNCENTDTMTMKQAVVEVAQAAGYSVRTQSSEVAAKRKGAKINNSRETADSTGAQAKGSELKKNGTFQNDPDEQKNTASSSPSDGAPVNSEGGADDSESSKRQKPGTSSEDPGPCAQNGGSKGMAIAVNTKARGNGHAGKSPRVPRELMSLFDAW